MKHIRWIAVVMTVLLFGIIAVFPLTAQDNMAEGEGELLALWEAYVDAWLTDLDALPEYLAEDVVRHQLFGPNMEVGELAEQNGIDEIAAGAAGFPEQFPGVGIVVDHSVEQGNYLWTASSFTEPLDPEGMITSVIAVARFADGKIAEIWIADDELAMLSLLNALPEAEE